MKIELAYINYTKRLLFHLIDWGSLYLLLVIFASWYIHIVVFVSSVIFFFYYIHRRIYESITCITRLNFKDGMVEVEWYYRNNGPNLDSCNSEDFHIEWFGSSQGQIASNRLVISVKGKIKFIQYSCGEWSVELMKRKSSYKSGYIINQ